MTWLEHVNKWKDCTRCPLHQQRDQIVLARGQVPCTVLFIGEAPGASENALGTPFVGPAGHLLDQIIERALPQITSYALTNLVACFPAEAKGRGDNEPQHSEIMQCQPRLVEFVRIAKPRLVVLVGSLAKEYVHGASQFRLDRQPKQPEWIPEDKRLEFCEVYHPAFILRMPLAQKQMAVQKTIVVLRNAVQDVLE